MNFPPKSPDSTKSPKWWGMAGVFPGALGVYDGDVIANKLRFVAERGFHGSGIHPQMLETAAHLELLHTLAAKRSQAYFVHYGIDLRAPLAEESARLQTCIRLHLSCAKSLPLPVAHFIVQNGQHRFVRDYPLEAQLDRIHAILAPITRQLRDQGIVSVIENHGDYYVSDLLAVCQRTPGLDLLLDTGNCFLIGERLDQIPDDAYPHIAATHFKDHWLHPDLKTLAFQLSGATLGEGHANLDAFMDKLRRLHPDPASVLMMIEWVPDPDKSAVDCFNASLHYLEKLSAGNFSPIAFQP